MADLGISFSIKLILTKGPGPPPSQYFNFLSNALVYEKMVGNQKTNVLISSSCSLSTHTHSDLSYNSNPRLRYIQMEKSNPEVTFYSWFTNLFKVPSLALTLFLVHHKNKCIEKPLGSLLCWGTSSPYFSLLVLPLITSHEAAALGTTARLLIMYLHGWQRFM